MVLLLEITMKYHENPTSLEGCDGPWSCQVSLGENVSLRAGHPKAAGWVAAWCTGPDEKLGDFTMGRDGLNMTSRETCETTCFHHGETPNFLAIKYLLFHHVFCPSNISNKYQSISINHIKIWQFSKVKRHVSNQSSPHFQRSKLSPINIQQFPDKSPRPRPAALVPRPRLPQDAADEDLPRAGGGSRRGQTGLGGAPSRWRCGDAIWIPGGRWLNLTMVYGSHNLW